MCKYGSCVKKNCLFQQIMNKEQSETVRVSCWEKFGEFKICFMWKSTCEYSDFFFFIMWERQNGSQWGVMFLHCLHANTHFHKHREKHTYGLTHCTFLNPEQKDRSWVEVSVDSRSIPLACSTNEQVLLQNHSWSLIYDPLPLFKQPRFQHAWNVLQTVHINRMQRAADLINPYFIHNTTYQKNMKCSNDETVPRFRINLFELCSSNKSKKKQVGTCPCVPLWSIF